jgi:hypothetical protein
MLVTVWGGAGSVTMLLAVITPSGWVGTGPRGPCPHARPRDRPDQPCRIGLAGRDHPDEYQAERYRPHDETGQPDHGRTEMAGAPQGGDSPAVSAAVVR